MTGAPIGDAEDHRRAAAAPRREHPTPGHRRTVGRPGKRSGSGAVWSRRGAVAAATRLTTKAETTLDGTVAMLTTEASSSSGEGDWGGGGRGGAGKEGRVWAGRARGSHFASTRVVYHRWKGGLTVAWKVLPHWQQ